MLRTLLRAALALLVAWTWHAGAAPAAAPDQELNDYQRTRWTQENGAPQQISGMAQTPDGWLWLGTDDGLYRFDGMTFTRFEPPALDAFAHRRVIALHGHANGSLTINYYPQDVAILHRDGRFDVLPQPTERWTRALNTNATDTDGSVWAIGDAIHHFSGGRWTTVERDREWGKSTMVSMLLDQDGRLWAASDFSVWRLDRTRNRFDKIADQGGELQLAPDGDVWVTRPNGGPATRIAPSASGKPRPRYVNAFESYFTGLFDTNGALWSLNCPNPVCLVRGAAARAGGVEPRRDADAVNGEPPHGSRRTVERMMLEDREGDIWVATANGLDRFRTKRFLSAGLNNNGSTYSLAVDKSGQAWAADAVDGSLWRLRAGQTALREPWPAAVSVLASGADGALLIGGKRAIWRRTPSGVETIALPPGPDGKPFDQQMIGILDDGKLLWTATMESGLLAWTDGHWIADAATRLPQQIYQSGAGGPGQLWLATVGGGLEFYDNGKVTHYDAGAVGIVSGIFAGPAVTVGGERGLAVVKDGRLQMLHAADPDVLRGMSGLAVTLDGDRWLNGAAGVVHVRAADWQRALARPETPLKYELFGAVDGYPGRANLATRLPTAITADGRNLWFLATGGVTGLDRADLRRNTVALDPMVQDVVTDDARFTPLPATGMGAHPALRLPPGAGNFRVEFTAPALRQPERVGFEYRLDGVDARWQDAGTRRSTSYTNVGPGAYVFRVRALNEDGVPGRAEVALPLTIAPTLVQSLPFKVACALALIVLATLLYRLRVRRLTRRVTERLQVKQDERERIARTLHDTILQTVQGLMLRLDALALSLPADAPAREALDAMLRDAGSAVGEGRDRVSELRATAVPVLEDGVRACVAELQALYPSVCCAVQVEGAPRGLPADVADEAHQIVREALRNAFTHAHARRIDVRIDHGRRALVLAVQDDGRGLDADVARAGHRSGHWGLIGMRERAARIGARLDITSGASNGPAIGTTITLTVPTTRMYAERTP